MNESGTEVLARSGTDAAANVADARAGPAGGRPGSRSQSGGVGRVRDRGPAAVGAAAAGRARDGAVAARAGGSGRPGGSSPTGVNPSPARIRVGGGLWLEIGSIRGGPESSGRLASVSGAEPVPSGRFSTAVVTLPASSATAIRTRSASAVPASHRCAPIRFGARIGTRFQTDAPSGWYSSAIDLSDRYSSFTSQRTEAMLPRLWSGSSTSDGGIVSMITFIFGSTAESRLGETWPSRVRVCTVNQYSPSCDARNEKAGCVASVRLRGSQLYPESSETSRITSLIRPFCTALRLNGMRKLRCFW